MQQEPKTNKRFYLIFTLNRLQIKTDQKKEKGNQILLKGTIQQKEIIIVNIDAPNADIPKF